MDKHKKTAVIILNYNNSADTLNCVRSVEQFNTSSIVYIIVDNGTKKVQEIEKLENGLSEIFAHRYGKIDLGTEIPKVLPYCSLVVNPANEGYARGNNVGLSLASKYEDITHVMILNNDVLFVEDIIPQLLKQSTNISDCAIISPALLKKDLKGYDDTCARMAPSSIDLIKECLMIAIGNSGYRNVIKKKYWMFVKNPLLREQCILKIQMPSGSCMLINKTLFEKIGFFDPNTFLYFEENILYARIKCLGLNNYLMPKLKCIHLGASSTKKVASSFIQKCGLESRSYYLRTYCNLSFFESLLFFVAKNLMNCRILIYKLSGK